jgi:hypothetical protein
MPNPKALKKPPRIVNGIVWGAAGIGFITDQSSGEVYYHFNRGHYGDAVWRFGPRLLVGDEKKLRRLGHADPASAA